MLVGSPEVRRHMNRLLVRPRRGSRPAPSRACIGSAPVSISVSSSISTAVSRRAEAIANTAHCLDILRVSGVALDFLSQRPHVHIYGPRIAEVVKSPHVAE